MTEPKRINMTYVGDGIKKIGGTYTSGSGMIHAVHECGHGASMCGVDVLGSYWSGDSKLDTSGKVEDVACKKCLLIINGGKCI